MRNWRSTAPSGWITAQADKSVPLPTSSPEEPSWSQRQYSYLAETFPRHLIGGARGLWNIETLVALTLAGTTYLLGDSLRAPRVRKVGEVALESLSLAGEGTAVLKGVTQRERPAGSNHLSFPSFHAAGSFSVAASLYEDYGIGVSLPAFLMAGFF